MLVSVLLCDMEMQSVLSFEYRRSRSFSDLAQKSLGFNVLKSETNRLVTLTDK